MDGINMNAKRKAVQDKILSVVSKIDPSGKNVKFYTEMFDKMTDKDFDSYMVRIKNHEDVLFLYSANMVDHLSIPNLVKVAKETGVKLFERIRIYDRSSNSYYYTPKKYAILQIPIRRMVQFADHKLTVAEGDSRVDILTGQVVKPDAGARISEPESRILHAFGFKNTLRELNKFRGGDVVAFAEYKRELEETGMTTVDRDTGTKVRSAVAVDVYYSGIHIESNASGL